METYRYEIIKRILGNSIPASNGCIEYAGGALSHKYGLISITINGIRKNTPSHRALFMATNNCLDLPTHVCIRHKCDNPPCVNIEHLEFGSWKDNAQDAIKRGRRAKKQTLHLRIRKLSNEQVLDIKSGVLTQKQYSHKHCVTIGYVSKLQSGIAKTLLN